LAFISKNVKAYVVVRNGSEEKETTSDEDGWLVQTCCKSA
jgi:hypothetical protein